MREGHPGLERHRRARHVHLQAPGDAPEPYRAAQIEHAVSKPVLQMLEVIRYAEPFHEMTVSVFSHG